MDKKNSLLMANMMSSSGGGSPIPAQYTVVDWIQPSTSTYNSATCYIDTGVTASENTILYFKMTFILYSDITSNTGYIGNLFGSEGYNGGYSMNIITYTGNTGSGNGGEANIFANGFGAHLVQNQKMSIELKDNVYTTSLGFSHNVTMQSNKTQKGTMYIFTVCGQGANPSYQAKMKLYDFKFGKSESELVRDYVPVYDTVTQKYGLWDKITQTFSTSTYSASYQMLGGND